MPEVVARVGNFLEASATALSEERGAADYDIEYGYYD